MATRISEIRTPGEYRDLVAASSTGDMIYLCETQAGQNEESNIQGCYQGVVEQVQGKGYFLNGELWHSYPSGSDWAPYQFWDPTNPKMSDPELRIIAVTKLGVIWLYEKSKKEIINKAGMSLWCFSHFYSGAVIVDEDSSDHTTLIQPTKASRRQPAIKFPFPWKKTFYSKHIHQLKVKSKTLKDMGNPDGPVFRVGNEFRLITATENKLIHKTARVRIDHWLASQGNILFKDKDEILCNDADIIWSGPYDQDKVFPTPKGCGQLCVIQVENGLFFPGTHRPFKELLPGDNVEAHPDGLLIEHPTQTTTGSVTSFSVLIIK
jgi:hypothetical protein